MKIYQKEKGESLFSILGSIAIFIAGVIVILVMAHYFLPVPRHYINRIIGIKPDTMITDLFANKQTEQASVNDNTAQASEAEEESIFYLADINNIAHLEKLIEENDRDSELIKDKIAKLNSEIVGAKKKLYHLQDDYSINSNLYRSNKRILDQLEKDQSVLLAALTKKEEASKLLNQQLIKLRNEEIARRTGNETKDISEQVQENEPVTNQAVEEIIEQNKSENLAEDMRMEAEKKAEADAKKAILSTDDPPPALEVAKKDQETPQAHNVGGQEDEARPATDPLEQVVYVNGVEKETQIKQKESPLTQKAQPAKEEKTYTEEDVKFLLKVMENREAIIDFLEKKDAAPKQEEKKTEAQKTDGQIINIKAEKQKSVKLIKKPEPTVKTAKTDNPKDIAPTKELVKNDKSPTGKNKEAAHVTSAPANESEKAEKAQIEPKKPDANAEGNKGNGEHKKPAQPDPPIPEALAKAIDE